MFNSDDELYNTIGQNIKKYRIEKKLTQLQLSEKSGVSTSLITKIESNKCSKSISISTLNAISKSLNIELYKFLLH
jgi:transcriptional regulator with XRE-family HTH domain